jgi:hypothetical protein
MLTFWREMEVLFATLGRSFLAAMVACEGRMSRNGRQAFGASGKRGFIPLLLTALSPRCGMVSRAASTVRLRATALNHHGSRGSGFGGPITRA